MTFYNIAKYFFTTIFWHIVYHWGFYIHRFRICLPGLEEPNPFPLRPPKLCGDILLSWGAGDKSIRRLRYCSPSRPAKMSARGARGQADSRLDVCKENKDILTIGWMSVSSTETYWQQLICLSAAQRQTDSSWDVCKENKDRLTAVDVCQQHNNRLTTVNMSVNCPETNWQQLSCLLGA